MMLSDRTGHRGAMSLFSLRIHSIARPFIRTSSTFKSLSPITHLASRHFSTSIVKMGKEDIVTAYKVRLVLQTRPPEPQPHAAPQLAATSISLECEVCCIRTLTFYSRSSTFLRSSRTCPGSTSPWTPLRNGPSWSTGTRTASLSSQRYASPSPPHSRLESTRLVTRADKRQRQPNSPDVTVQGL